MIIKFFRRGKGKKKKKKEPANMWEMMQKMSEDFKEQEKRIQEKRQFIEKKRSILAAKGIDIGEINIEKPGSDYKDELTGSESMWDMMKLMDRKFQEEMEYLDSQEKALDEAIAKIDAGEYPATVAEDRKYAEKKRVLKE